ncbi:fibronectin type III domain-containing protein [Pedobacter chitinilyticus]|uniref:Fibronectin type III domain-containing protein n=1 Tax=Pedobacter chitinilyticus TaxID=2233776 RepID=A0A443YV16_9SPHI|nr:fibronectin type III domain-containing protein [Pedobacter chitinilyticus]RWU07720.1 fibronectin type III domain-containing protein [Pedobacter chitinilyticus]
MQKPKLSTSHSKYSDAELEVKTAGVIAGLTNNPGFPTPIPTLEEIKIALEAFSISVVKAREGGKTETLVRDQKRKVLTDLLEKLALYVQLTSDDEAVLSSSGFSLAKTPEPIGILTKPQGFSVHPEMPGTIKVMLNAIKGAGSYLYENRKKGEEIWRVTVHTKSNLLITGLESGVLYEFRVAGVGSDPQRVYSDILSSYIL